MSRFDRYVLREIAVPLAFSVGFVVFVVFLFQIQRLAGAAVGFGLTGEDVLVIMVSALPPFLVPAIPIAFLLSTLIGLGRLSSDLELTAMRAAGASGLRIARVPVVFGAVVSALCLPLSLYGAPLGMQMLYDRLIDVGLRNVTGAIRPGVFNEQFAGVALYAGGRREGALTDVLLFDERDPAQPVLLVASTGRLTPHGDRNVLIGLEDGEIHLGAGTDRDSYDRVSFESATLGIDTNRELQQRTRFVGELGRLDSEQILARAAMHGPKHPLGRRVEKTYWRRFAFPAMALVFAVLATAIALGGHPDARARSAILALLSVVGYYMLIRIGDVMAVRYEHTIWLAAFGPNLLMLGVGVFALTRAGRPR